METSQVDYSSLYAIDLQPWVVIFGQAACENVHCLVIVCTIYKGVLPPSEWSIPLFLLKSSLSPSSLRILSLFTHRSQTRPLQHLSRRLSMLHTLSKKTHTMHIVNSTRFGSTSRRSHAVHTECYIRYHFFRFYLVPFLFFPLWGRRPVFCLQCWTSVFSTTVAHLFFVMSYSLTLSTQIGSSCIAPALVDDTWPVKMETTC